MKQGHRISAIDGFPAPIARALHSISITTAEELLAQARVDHQGTVDALHLDRDEFERALGLASEAAGEAYVSTLDSLANDEERVYGALKPTSDEFDEWVRRGEGSDDDQAGSPSH